MENGLLVVIISVAASVLASSIVAVNANKWNAEYRERRKKQADEKNAK